jgi:hypothetical protein
MLEYFDLLLTAAIAAAEPDAVQEADRCDDANVSGQVKSHARQRPRCQGTDVTPSGRFPLFVQRLCGSLVA